MDSLTADAFFNGRIQVKQHRSGYRFSMDAVLIAFHAKPIVKDNSKQSISSVGLDGLLYLMGISEREIQLR